MKTIDGKTKFSCIIPFYNESISSILLNVREALKVSQIGLVVVVDDGSKSVANYNILKTIFINRPNVLIKRLESNLGKTFAIYHGLKHVPEGNVFLCDSDLKKLDKDEISSAILKYDSLGLNMIILRRINTGFFPKLIRADTLLSGERVLHKKDLTRIIQSGVKGYQLEVSINQYFLKNNLENNCFWSPSSAVNNYKYKKLKFFKGIFKDLKMYFSIIKHIGFKNYLNQFSVFCKQKV